MSVFSFSKSFAKPALCEVYSFEDNFLSSVSNSMAWVFAVEAIIARAVLFDADV